MATRAQIAAAKRNIRKAQAARKKLASPRRRAKRNDNPTRRTARRAGATRRTTRRRTRRDNPVEILEANPVRRARRRRRPIATKKRTVYVRRSKPRRGKRQSVINVHVLDRKKRRAAPRRRRAAATRRRATTRRRTRRAAPRIAGLLPPARMANPAYGYDENPAYESNPTRRRKPRRKPKRKTARRRRRSGVTQSIRVRRSTRAIHLYRNPMTGAMALGDNPVSYGYDDNPLGGMDDNPWSPALQYGQNPRGMSRRHGMGMNPGNNWSPALNYDDNPMGMTSYDDNPTDLLDNPDDGGAFGMANIKKFGVAAGGVALGLIVADFVDRYVATRKPKDAGELKAFGPWYGRDAAAAYRQKPDAMRLGVQALGAGGSMFLAYKLRNKSWAPWLFGGLAIGFGANLVKMLADWYLMPMVLKVEEKNSGKASLANRLYPLEQGYVQEKVQNLFKDWSTTSDLAAAQAETPTIVGPLTETPGTSVYTLGDPNAQPRVANQLGRPLVPTGRVGTCGSCGGQNGCYTGCPTSCPGNCPQGVMPGQDSALPKCMYTVDERVNLMAVATEIGVNVNEIMALNSYADASVLQMVGAEVILPNRLCVALELMEKGAAAEQAQRMSTTQGAPSNVERMMQPSMELVAPSAISTLAEAPVAAPISTIAAAPEAPASMVSTIPSTIGSTSSIGSSRSKLRGDAFLRTLGDAGNTDDNE